MRDTGAPIVMIVGPTASGKTAAALELARRIGGEIISADSRQCFRELPISTAQPSAEELREVPHHFIADRTLNAPMSAGSFAREAEARMTALVERGVTPIVVGGSTLYLKALRDGLAELPTPPPDVRAALNERLAREGLAALAAELTQRDPEGGRTTDLKNPARVVRALEILEITGLPLAAARAQVTHPPRFTYEVRPMLPARATLHARIDARVLEMDRHGLRHEVRGVLDAGWDPALPTLRTIGIVEVIDHLTNGTDWGQTLKLIQAHTRQYARRQITYFQKFFGLQ